MRAQYHSRQSARGRLIWDVRRLVRLAEGRPAEEVPLGALPYDD